MFENSKAKVKRAKDHLEDLEVQVEKFFADGAYRLVIKDERETSTRCIRIAKHASIPVDFSLILGDTVHNLRAALDILAWEIAAPCGAKANKVQFPFCKEAAFFEQSLVHRQISLAHKNVVQLFRDLKPYPGGNGLLYGLHRLDLVDKHLLIIPSTSLTSISINLQDIDPHAPDVSGLIIGSAGEEGNVASWPIHPGGTTQSRAQRRVARYCELNRTFTIMFGFGQPFYMNPVTPVLRDAAAMVDDIIVRFENVITGLRNANVAPE